MNSYLVRFEYVGPIAGEVAVDSPARLKVYEAEDLAYEAFQDLVDLEVTVEEVHDDSSDDL